MSHDRMVGVGKTRSLSARWVVCGDLVLEAACHLGNGDVGDRIDLPLVRDLVEGRPLLTGTSLAGGLRSHVYDRLIGFGVREQEEDQEPDHARASRLFGGRRGDDEGSQSPLIVFDSLADATPAEVRDGVALNSARGTAEEHLKFDFELIPAGTRFPLRLELLVSQADHEANDLALLALALTGLQNGDIPLGARRSRGLGACRASNWRVKRFDLSARAGWLAWLASDHLDPLRGLSPLADIAQALRPPEGSQGRMLDDRRDQVRIEVALQVRGGLLVRSPGLEASAADAGHLHSGGQPILPGTSLAGALRARALRIASLVRAAQGDAERWIEGLFGPRLPKDRKLRFRPCASRLRTSERRVIDGQSLRAARIRVDRFTSGVVDGGLFDEEPSYRGRVELTLVVRRPRSGELGLLLLVLKDLLTGDLPLGGSSSVGRGVVRGRAELHLPGRDNVFVLDPEARANPEGIRVLNGYVEEFHRAAVAPEGP
jgi:CRISPR/Cas system CSM-associated protein Csm3 (group 7 of RAMP superfamily)